MDMLSRDDQARLTAGATMWETASAEGVPAFKMADGPMGIASGRVDERDVSVLTPSGVALGATFDRDLVGRVGALVGAEARKLGVNVILAPNLNMPRSPLTGRAFEMFSEDPFLTGSMGAAWIGGVQGAGAGAVAKHLVCNDSETLRDRYDAIVDERALRELYLKPFEMAVSAGCIGVMAAYNKLDGTHCVEHAGLITDILKDEWGFGGFTVCDWFGTKDTVSSAKAGLDLEMPGPARVFGEKFAQAIDESGVAPERLADAAGRVAASARTLAAMPALGVEEADARALLTEASAAGFVMLRNEGKLLPIAPGSVKRIAVIGPNAANPAFQGGTFAKIAVRPDALTPIAAIRARYESETEIVFAPGVDAQPRLPAMPVTPTRDLGDNARGMTVEFFGDHAFAEPLAAETRDTNSLTWFSAMPGIGAMDRPAGIRASGIFTPAQSGDHLLYIGGTGSVRLLVDGVQVYAEEADIAPADLMGILKSGEAEHVAVRLEAGRPVTITCELRFQPMRAHGLWYGIRAPGTPDEMLAQAVAAARVADAVVLVVGESADSGVESRDRDTTKLADNQLALIEQVCAVNDRVAIVANVAHAFDTAFEDRARALVISWFPGQEFGPALAAVLAGDLEPGGRLPVSIARRDEDYPVMGLAPDADGRLAYAEGIGLGYRGFRTAPRHAFGAGFGYADFALSDPALDDDTAVNVTVANVSDRRGKTVVQVYVGNPSSPAPELKGFEALHLDAGETRTISIVLDARAFQHWDAETHRWATAPGERRIAIGLSSADCPLLLTRIIEGA